MRYGLYLLHSNSRNRDREFLLRTHHELERIQDRIEPTVAAICGE